MTLRPAADRDAAGIKACIDACYGHYVERVGGLPHVFMRKLL